MSNDELIKTIYDIEQMVETDPEDNRREILQRLIEVRADLTRLQTLVQAQKELIEIYENAVLGEALSSRKVNELNNKIKELEQ